RTSGGHLDMGDTGPVRIVTTSRHRPVDPPLVDPADEPDTTVDDLTPGTDRPGAAGGVDETGCAGLDDGEVRGGHNRPVDPIAQLDTVDQPGERIAPDRRAESITGPDPHRGATRVDAGGAGLGDRVAELGPRPVQRLRHPEGGGVVAAVVHVESDPDRTDGVAGPGERFGGADPLRSEEHTSELQSREKLVC